MSTTASAAAPKTSVPLQCPQCAVKLDAAAEQVACPACKRTWPIRDGVPIFFEPPYYWGEIPQDQAGNMVRVAGEMGWRTALERQCGNDPAMVHYIADSQRASWLALLALDRNSVALDIGSGYGAITHALAAVAGEVYSLEAIPERIAFTRVRMQQEGFSNVNFVQGSALELPFCENSFDLIVSNGVLEWVGDWVERGNPRDIQVRFLARLRSLLKEGGRLLIGIENRIGYASFRGDRDHSGLRYTSLMPRDIASFYLRHTRTPHHRTTRKSEYRTYTYSEAGYRNLLQDAGFTAPRFYWADPGYNQPHVLIPLRDHVIQHYVDYKSCTPQVPQPQLSLKRVAARLGVTRALASCFVIVAERDSGSRNRAEAICDALLPTISGISLTRPSCLLFTYRYAPKSVIQVFNEGESEPAIIIKAASADARSRALLQCEYRNLTLAHARLANAEGVTVPKPLASVPVGNLLCCAEAAASGQPLAQAIYARPKAQRCQFFFEHAPRALGAATRIGIAVKDLKDICAVPRQWLQIPASLAALSTHLDLNAPGCVQHGDFTIDNVFMDSATGTITVIDWEHLMCGLPPLFDTYCLLLSALPAFSAEAQRQGAQHGPLEGEFLLAFFQPGPVSAKIKEFVLQACTRLGLAADQALPMFYLSLLIRSNYMSERGAKYAAAHRRLLEAAVVHSKSCTLRRQS